MIFKIHYFCLTSGACTIGMLLGVFMATYTDASSLEIGALLMVMPFTGIVFRPVICLIADREQAHQRYLINCLLIVAISYSPFVVIPYLDIHDEHPRVCWYILIVFRVIGDIAFGGMMSIGDALAVNYANRVGIDFSVYRLWGTIGWMTFGIIIGQINEVHFMPRYVPAFLVLIGCTLLNMTVIWLWPKEYFKMVSIDLKNAQNQLNETGEDRRITKSLMSKEMIWGKMKEKLNSLFSNSDCDCCSKEKKEESAVKQLAIDQFRYLPQVTVATAAAAAGDLTSGGKSIPSQQPPASKAPIDKRTQFRMLLILFHRDPRILLYLAFFVCTGLAIAPLNFFIISLSDICESQNSCQFSELTGHLLVSMASSETVLFIFMKQIKSKLGRVNMCIGALFIFAVKFLFYGTIYSQVSPYYAILAEILHGIGYGINLTLMTEMGHLFANEVNFILPELMARGLIKDNSPAEAERLKLSLSATMQALMSTASDGIGRGAGTLIYALILESYTFETLWLIVGVGASVAFLVSALIKIFDSICEPHLGLDVRAKLAVERNNNSSQIPAC